MPNATPPTGTLSEPPGERPNPEGRAADILGALGDVQVPGAVYDLVTQNCERLLDTL